MTPSPKALALVLAMGLLALIAGSAAGAAPRCTSADAALHEAGTWAALHRWFARYSECEEGDLPARVSAVVTTSLAKDWRDLERLERRVDRDPDFEEFVLRHIDATADRAHLEAIAENATQRCPARSSDLCIEVLKRALEALNKPARP
ncbi:MAG TPA: hypothetical protein VEL74_18220 [Thermoanaerobaculia bacterium]|nr:hypothetical protein [Thermoanaerobaculia bacterium]